MSLRTPAGFVRPGFDPLKNPDAPTSVSATGGDATASVSFTAPANPGGSAISAYYAVSNPGQITGTAASSPVSVTGLTNGTSYTFQVWALNTYGPGVWSAASGSVTPAAPRGLFGGGNFVGGNTIQYITISSTGNATDFGDLISSEADLGACSSSTRALFLGRSKVINYVTISTTGNAANFGDGYNTGSLNYRGVAGCSNSTRGLWGGNMNYAGSAFVNTVSYSTIATTGNGTYFGDLTVSVNCDGACSSTTRGVFAGANDGASNVVDYITIASAGNATDFGDMLVAVGELAACSSTTLGVWIGGFSPSAGTTNTIQYVTIASTGNMMDWGDMVAARSQTAACSSVHGGLQ